MNRRGFLTAAAATGLPGRAAPARGDGGDLRLGVCTYSLRNFPRAKAIAMVKELNIGLVSIAVLETLAELLGEQACPQMCTALDHPDEEVVSVALDLLGRYGAGPWLAANAEALVNHPAWNVRAHCVRLLAGLLGAGARPVLERRLAVESDELVAQQIRDLLQDLPPA